MSKLFTPLQVGNNQLQQRIVMAPLTRYRANEDHVPLPMMKEYYSQRASVPGTLIIGEATMISEGAGSGLTNPGIYNDEQIKAWKEITDAVHAKGSFMWCQIWHLGRAGDPDHLKSIGYKHVSSSATPMEDGAPVPEALTEEEIQEIIATYTQAARNAMAAGFDGVEIHGANGYLVDQFTQDTCNKRTDSWGGSVENRARFGIEVAKSVVAAIGAERTSMRLSPYSSWQGMLMKDPIPGFSYLVESLKPLNLAYLHVVESRVAGVEDSDIAEKIDFLVDIWGSTSPVFLAGGFKPDSAKKAVDEEHKNRDVAVVFGRYFISNPDLIFKLKKGIDLRPYDRSTFYTPMLAKGYSDYPFSEEFVQEKRLHDPSPIYTPIQTKGYMDHQVSVEIVQETA